MCTLNESKRCLDTKVASPQISFLRHTQAILASILFAHLLANPLFAKWDDIPPAELEATECEAYPDMAAEILFKRQILDEGESANRFREFHLRLKVYDESAIEAVRNKRIFYSGNSSLNYIAARVVKPDGSMTELHKDDIYEKLESKNRSRTVYSKSFSLPNLDVGDILEYRYRINSDEGYYTPRLFVTFQEDWPIRRLELKIRPYIAKGVGFKWIRRNHSADLERKANGFYVVVIENLAPYPDEPNQMPDRYEKAHFQFFEVMNMRKGENYWKAQAVDLYRRTENKAKADATIKAKAKSITKGISAKEDKLKAIYTYCVTAFRNASQSEPGKITADERKKIDSDSNAQKILKSGYGNGYNCNVLFCALAKAAGFDARIAAISDRSKDIFVQVVENLSMSLPDIVIAIKSNPSDEWSFYDPGLKYLKFGELNWTNQGVTALIGDKKETLFVKTAAPYPKANNQNGSAALSLSEDGTLSGKVKISLGGCYNTLLQTQLDGQSPKNRKETLRKELSKQYSNATFRSIELSNVADPLNNIQVSFQIEIQRYAESVGDRLVINPNLFYRYDDFEYTSEKRYTGLYYPFPYFYSDRIEIALPANYQLDQASAPRPVKINSLFDYNPKLSFNKSKHMLIYSRSFEFEGSRFQKEAYPIIKRAFDQIYQQDQHTITIKKMDTGVGASSLPQSSPSNT